MFLFPISLPCTCGRTYPDMFQTHCGNVVNFSSALLLVCVRTRVSVRVRVRTCLCTRMCLYVCVRVRMSVRVSVHAHVSVRVDIGVHRIIGLSSGPSINIGNSRCPHVYIVYRAGMCSSKGTINGGRHIRIEMSIEVGHRSTMLSFAYGAECTISIKESKMPNAR